MMKCHYRIYKYLCDCNISAPLMKQGGNECHAKTAMPKKHFCMAADFYDRSLLYGNVLAQSSG